MSAREPIPSRADLAAAAERAWPEEPCRLCDQPCAFYVVTVGGARLPGWCDRHGASMLMPLTTPVGEPAEPAKCSYCGVGPSWNTEPAAPQAESPGPWCKASKVEGCSGDGRPSCEATECMLGVEPCPECHGFKPEGGKCNWRHDSEAAGPGRTVEQFLAKHGESRERRALRRLVAALKGSVEPMPWARFDPPENTERGVALAEAERILKP